MLQFITIVNLIAYFVTIDVIWYILQLLKLSGISGTFILDLEYFISSLSLNSLSPVISGFSAIR